MQVLVACASVCECACVYVCVCVYLCVCVCVWITLATDWGSYRAQTIFMQSHSSFIKTSREEKPQPARRAAAASTGYKLTVHPSPTSQHLPPPLPSASSLLSILQAPPQPSRRLLLAGSAIPEQPLSQPPLTLSSLCTCSFFSSVLFAAWQSAPSSSPVFAVLLLGDFGMALTCRTPFTLHSNSEKFYSIRILKFSICCCCCCFGSGARILRSKNLSNSSLWVIVSVIVFRLLSFVFLVGILLAQA